MQKTIDLETSDCFFHYTTREAAFEHILPTQRLRFSAYEQMRDPLENRPWQFVGAFFVDSEDPQRGERQYFEFTRGSHSVFRLAHLLALTVDAQGYSADGEHFAKGWARARMWEQYAENHAGICLAFDRERFTANVEKDLHEQLGVRPYHRPVQYSETGGESHHHLSLGQFPGQVDNAFVEKYIEDHNDELFFQKTLDWLTEHEYRFVTTAPPDKPLYADYGDALVGIVIGWQIPDWERPAAIEAAHAVGIEAVEINWNMGQPLPVPFRPRSREEREQFEANFRMLPQADPPRSPAP
jgi:hypothetical protein